MADLGESVRALLLADASVAAEVGKRIVPDQLAQGESVPAIAYRVISSRHYNDIRGAKAGMRASRLTLECYETTRAAANALAELVRLSGILDWYGDAYGVDVRGVTIDDGQAYLTEQNSEGSHELRYITTQDFLVHFTEST